MPRGHGPRCTGTAPQGPSRWQPGRSYFSSTVAPSASSLARVISSFFEQHASLQLKDALMLDAIIGHAVHLAYVDGQPEREASYNDRKAEAWEAFYTRPPSETAGYLVGALRLLLAPRATLPPPSNAVLSR